MITGTGGPRGFEDPRGSDTRAQGVLQGACKRVRACGVNRADLLQRGMYSSALSAPADIPCLEYAGEIDAVGPDVVGPKKPGDRVFGIVAGGGQGEYVLTHERMAVMIPPNLDFVEAAAVPEAFITAHDALLNQGQLVPGESAYLCMPPAAVSAQQSFR